MAAAIPISLPEPTTRPFNLKPVSSPNDPFNIWDLNALGLSGENYRNISVDSFIADIGIGTLVEISTVKTLRNLPDVPVTMYMVSTNVADTKPIFIEYLDENMEYKEGIFILNGTTPVELPLMYRVLFAENLSREDIDAYLTGLGVSGYTIGQTLGTVTFYKAGGTGTINDADTMAGWNPSIVNAGIKVEKTLLSSFTIPAGYAGFAFNFEPILGRNDEVFFSVQTRGKGGPWVTRIPFAAFQNEFQRELLPRRLPPLTDIRVLAVESGGTAGIPVTFSYQLLLIKEEPR